MKLLDILILACLATAVCGNCPTLYISRSSSISGALSSEQSYPHRCNNSYSHNLRCNYELVPARDNLGAGVNFVLHYFNTEIGYDFVLLDFTDESGYSVTAKFSGSVGQYSGKLLTKPFTPIRLSWITDHSVDNYGFLVRYYVVPAIRYRLGGTVDVSQDGVRGSFDVQRILKK